VRKSSVGLATVAAMRFSVWPNPAQPWSEILGVARHAEATGWDGVYFADHFMPNAPDPAPGPTIECWSVMAALAASVPRVRLGTLVSGNTYRHPAVLANIAAAVDNISDGRLLLGLGAGWQENEHNAYGIDFFTTRERLERLEEACQVVRGLLDDERANFQGRYYRLADAPNEPKPVQAKLPLLIGGGGEKVTMRIAATYADEWNCWGTPELHEQKRNVLERHCETIGRDPGEIKRSAQGLLFLSTDEEWLAGKRGEMAMPTMVGTADEVRDVVAGYADAGVDELIIPDFTLGKGSRRTDTYDLFINEVAANFR
jgi:F420-dependent oxidoreductase-like protein